MPEFIFKLNIMKLYDVPEGSRIKISTKNTQIPPSHRSIKEEEEFIFHRLDGMFSYCTTDNGEVVHIAGWTEVEIIMRNKPTNNRR